MYLFFALILAIQTNSQWSLNQPSWPDKRDHPADMGLFLGSGMNGVVITLDPGDPGSDLRDYISHLDGGQRGIEALVPTFGTGPLNRLLDVVGSENAIDHRNAGIESNRGNPL